MNIFCEFGFPRVVKSDGGPQFRGPFLEFCNRYNIKHELSSPYNPRSNGLAEAAVKSVKSLLRKLDGKFDDEFRVAHLAWRSTPRPDGFSPAFGFFGRHIRTTTPDIRDPALSFSADFAVARSNTREKSAADNPGHALRPLQEGERVLIQDTVSGTWTVDGTVVRLRPSGRSYDVSTSGGVFARNRRFLRPVDGGNQQIFADESTPEILGDSTPAPLRRSARIAGQSTVSFANTLQVWF